MNYITIVMSLKIILTISLFSLVSSDQCSTSVSNFQFANFGDTNVDEDSYKKLVQSLSEMKHSALQMEQKLHRMFTASCSIEHCENGGTCEHDTCLCNDGFSGSKCEIDVNKTCQCGLFTLIPHPNKCQLYYNCSQAVSPLPTADRLNPHIPQVLRPAYLHECPYPELFSTKTMSCKNYTDVNCGSRYETKNKCDYLAIYYHCLGACRMCIYYTPQCDGFADGIYHENGNWFDPADLYFECRDERFSYRGSNPCKTNMAPHNGECRDLFEIPATYSGVGNAVNCYGRPNGNYKSERIQRCDIYYTCVNGNSTLSHCGNGTVFDSKSSFCQIPANACVPCGSVKHGC